MPPTLLPPRPVGQRLARLLITVLATLAGAWAPLSHAAEAAPNPLLKLLPEFKDDQAPWRYPEPLAVRVGLHHSATESDDVATTPVVIDPGKPWAETVTLAVTGPDGRSVTLPWVRSGPTTVAALSLLPDTSANMVFFLPADPLRVITPGRYTMQATMVISAGTGWTGRVTSEPVIVEAVTPPSSAGSLELSVIGNGSLAPGDPWVISVGLNPPLASYAENALRSGYHVAVSDTQGRDLGWAVEPAATPPSLGTQAQLVDAGLSPILLVIPASSTAQASPGTYQLSVSWLPNAGSSGLTNRIPIILLPRATAEALPERSASVLRWLFAEANALLWRAEFSSTAQIEALTARAAPLLIDAERLALRNFGAAPAAMETAAVAADLFLLQGDFGGARAFARLALNAWKPETNGLSAEDLELAALAPAPTELQELLDTIDQRSAQAPGRVLPVLRPAITNARGFDSSNPESFAPGEAAWAVSARASSEYRASDFSASQATNAPNVPSHADHPRAWAPRLADAGEEWLELTYSPAFRAAGLRVVQSFNPGAIVRLEVIDESGTVSTVWTGPDTTVYPARQIGILSVTFPPTERPVAQVRVILDTRRVAGWNEIDAVQLLAAPEVPADPPTLRVQFDPQNPGILTVPAWPSGFRLERTTHLVPGDWTEVPGTPPLQIRTEQPVEFLRLRETR
jgi:hypothetical protein